MPTTVDNLSNHGQQFAWGDAVGGYYGQTFVAADALLTQLEFVIAAWSGGTTDLRVVITTWDGTHPGTIVGMSDLLSVSAAGVVTVNLSGFTLTPGATYAFLLDTTYGTSNSGSGAIGAEYEGFFPGTVADYAGGHFFYNHGENPDGSHNLSNVQENRTYEDLNFRLTFESASVINGTPDDDVLIGTPGDDTINALAGNDVVNALAGNDTINGDEGHDLLNGQQGDDIIFGGSGDDLIRAGTGNDSADGGAGFDRVSYASVGTDNLTSGVTVSLALQGVAQDTGGGGIDTLTGFEHLTGTRFSDNLTGDGNNNWLWGGFDPATGAGGDDTYSGGGGNDLIQLSLGSSVADGGSDNDTLTFFGDDIGVPTGVTFSLALQGTTQSTSFGNVTASTFENLSGTIFDDNLTGDGSNNVLAGDQGNDILYGGGGSDTLYGDGQITVDTHDLGYSGPIATIADVGAVVPGAVAGNDILDGGDGDDILVGGAGNDSLLPGAGFDSVDGGAGIDTVSYWGATGPVDLNLQFGFADEYASDELTYLSTDTLVSIEYAIGSNYADALVGSAGDNYFDGVGGNDLIRGGGGNDQIFGSGGNDDISGDFGIAVLTGGGNDNLDGGDGNDTVRGRDGNDIVVGGSGNDFVEGGTGDDIVNGGSGVDRAAFYSMATVGVHVDLNLQGVAQNTNQGMDTLVGIENVSGSQFGDTLIGDGNDNQLWGSPATLGDGSISPDNNDTLDGGGGNDLLTVGIGNHSLTGGSGIDTVSFTENGQPEPDLNISLELQGVAQATGAGIWTLNGIENLSGGIANDQLTGDGADNVLAGDTGNDLLSGGAGDDTLYGDGGIGIDFGGGPGSSGPIATFPDVTSVDPSLIAGNDMLEGGAGNDHLDGGGGNDTASYAGNGGPVEVNLQFGFADEYAGDGITYLSTDTLVNIENAIGSAFDDVLSGNNADNLLQGLGGNDLIIGNAGNDTLDGGEGNDTLRGDQAGNGGVAGNDTLLGGNGNDFLNGGFGDDHLDGGFGYDRATFFSGATGGVHVDLNLQGSAQDTGQGMDTLLNIENVSGTAFGDTLIGDSGDNQLWGSPATLGDGSISPDNNDTLDGGGGNDLLTVGIGNHSLTGGSGTDTVSFTENGQPESDLNISLELQGVAQATGAGTWTLNGIENLSGGIANDQLTGDGADNVLAGDTGNDLLSGGAGNDTLYGDGRIAIDHGGGPGTSGPIATFADVTSIDPSLIGGDDTLEGGEGSDHLDGGSGSDTASYANAVGPVEVNLRFGFADEYNADESAILSTDTLVNIENAIGSAFNDALIGSDVDNVLDGAGGADLVQGGVGNDTLYGGAGNDTVQGDRGEAYTGPSGNDTLYGGDGNDTLRGGLGNDTLSGGANNDHFRGNEGVDSFDGGSDDGEGFNGIGDRISFFEQRATQGVVADLRTGLISNDGFGNVETMTGIESLGGDTAYSDTFHGDDNRNLLFGSRGDNLYGHGDDDLFQIASATATLDGGSGTDTVFLTAGGGWLTPDSNGDGLAEIAAAATEGWFINLLTGAMFDGYGNFGTVTGIENVDGTELADEIRGDDNDNVLRGLGGDDVLVGNGGNDTIEGGDGSDFMRGDAQNYTGGPFGNDILIGGAGDDHMRGSAGVDYFDGGTDSGGESIYGGIGDRISFFEMAATAGVVADLRTGLITNDGFGNVETMVGIESLGGDTAFIDTFYGNDGRNTVLGGRGDNLYGFGGDDNFSIAVAAGTIDGGDGIDVLQLNSAGGWLLPDGDADGVAEMAAAATSGWTVDLAAGTVVDGYGNVGTVSGIENVDGSELGDMLAGDANDNVLNGNDGDDTIEGRGGSDTLDGGNGTDTVSYANAVGPVDLNLGAGFAHEYAADGTTLLSSDTLANFENAVGSAFGDILVGNNGDNVIEGLGGNDQMFGQQGNDTLDGGDGDDFASGGQGADTILGGAGADNLNGNQGDDIVDGGDGGDIVVGNPGNDTLYGGAGDDFLRGDNADGLTPGNDYIDAGAGFDRVTYYNTNNAVTVDLNLQGVAQDTGQGMDILLGTEAISGSIFSDTLIGDDNANWFFIGGAGIDHHTVTSDTISGNGGDDLIVAGLGNHVLDGGTGTDTLGFIFSRSEIFGGVTISLELQGAAQDTGQGSMILNGFENLSGSTFDDSFTGNGGNNLLAGASGSDILRGGAGNDVLLGDGEVNMGLSNPAGAGPITTFESVDYSAVDFYDSTGTIVYLFEGQDLYDSEGNLLVREDLVDEFGDSFSRFTLDGATYDFYAGFNTTSDGVAGDDTLEGGLGDDTLNGGGGNDTASYENNGGPVDLNLQFGFADEYAADGITYLSSDTLVSIENATGSAFGDFLVGSDGANILRGLGGHDTLIGGAGDDTLEGGEGNDSLRGDNTANSVVSNDTLRGGNGNDFLNGGFGDDTLDGGAGYDRATYFSGATTGVTVDLNIQGVAQDTGSQGLDTLTDIENVSGTAYGDTLTGNGGDNWLWGSTSTNSAGVSTGANNDTLDGGGGNDLLMVGTGNHSLTGGSGTDAVTFTENGVVPDPGVTVSLAIAGAQATGAGTWTLNGIENLSGGTGGDTLTGDGSDNVLAGNTGNDSLVGGAGNDALYGDGAIQIDYDGGPGTSGPIALFADVTSLDPLLIAGNDTLDGGAGDDFLIGGGGVDTASFASAGGSVQAFLYNGGFGEALSAEGYDQLYDIENLTGSAFDDQLGGNNLANVLSGGDGHDTLRGFGGNDTLLGGNGDDFLNGNIGDDSIDGGAGWDRATFASGAVAGVTVDLNIVGAQNTGQGLDTLSNIEHVSGTAFNDTLTGDGGDNWIWGQGATDVLTGNGGNDLIQAGAAGNLTASGGSGTDTLSVNDNGAGSSGVTVSLALQGGAQTTGIGSYTLSGFENLSGSSGNDTLTGDGVANVLAGDQGDDTLVGGGGNDTLYGDGQIAADTHGSGASGPITTFADVGLLGGVAGNDTLEGGLGNDTLNGGGGTDTARYANASGAVTVDLTAGTATGADGADTLIGIENVTGSAFADTITGDANANVLNGGDGNDTLNGRLGNDTLSGGNGVDTATYANASGAVVVNLTTGSASGADGADTLTSIENATGSQFADTITGNASANLLNGGDGDDTLNGRLGNDALNGGNGIDTASYADASGAVTVNLNTGNASGADGSDTLTSIENATGSQFADTITGDTGANRLNGGDGNDTMFGGRGDDYLHGGRGNDTLSGSQGNDRYVIEADSGTDRVIDFALGNDKIVFDLSSGVDSYSDLTLTKVGNNTVITWGTGASLTVDGLKPSQLSASSFEFSSGFSAAAANALVSKEAFDAPAFDHSAGFDMSFDHGVLHLPMHDIM